jgi:hypothetical protein
VTRERLLDDSYVPEDYMIDDMENPLTDEE